MSQMAVTLSHKHDPTPDKKCRKQTKIPNENLKQRNKKLGIICDLK